MKHFYRNIKALFVLDLRSLSLMRIGIALTLLMDLSIRLYNLEAHYTSQGILPLNALFLFTWNDLYFSLYTISGSVYIQFLIFILNFICILCLLIGYRTRLFTIICWIFLLSLHNRNPLIHQGGDDLLRLILFWGIFLPWNANYSIDALKSDKILKENSWMSFAGFAYMLQVGYVYFFSALLKSSDEWTTDYSALYYALSFDQIVLPLGQLIYPHEVFLKILTFMVYYIELLIPLLLIVPFFISFLRTAFVIAICFLHTGIFLCLNVGLFPLIGIVSLLALLPGDTAEKIVKFFTLKKNLASNLRLKFIDKYIHEKKAIYLKENFYIKSAVLFLAAYVLYWNFTTLNFVKSSYFSESVGYLLRIDQHWGMFSPSVFKDDGWFIFAAETKDGKSIDIIREGRRTTYTKMAAVTAPFTQDRWRKYSENILFVNNNHLRPYYCSYLLNQWNKRHAENKIKSLQIIYMKEISLPNYKIKGPTKEILCDCAIK